MIDGIDSIAFSTVHTPQRVTFFDFEAEAVALILATQIP